MSVRLGSRARVLVMDNEHCIRDTSEKLLGELGFAVDTARNGTEAVSLVAEAVKSGKPYQLVILDLTVPDGGGAVETLPKLKEIDPDVKAIITSGYHNSPEMQWPQKYGFFGNLLKPCGIAEWRSVMDKVLR